MIRQDLSMYPHKYDAVIFDLDGTILDTLMDLTNSVNYSLRLHSLPEVSPLDVRSYLGNGMERLIRLSMKLSPLGDLSPEELSLFQKVHKDFKEHYAIHSQDLTRPYAGVTILLKQLRFYGCKTAVVSNKGDFAVQPLIASHFPGLFDFACGEKEGIRRKPAPDTVEECLRVLGVPASKAIYIGDSEVDIETARNAGMPCIAVTWGFRDKEDLVAAGATMFADSPAGILDYIE